MESSCTEWMTAGRIGNRSTPEDGRVDDRLSRFLRGLIERLAYRLAAERAFHMDEAGAAPIAPRRLSAHRGMSPEKSERHLRLQFSDEARKRPTAPMHQLLND